MGSGIILCLDSLSLFVGFIFITSVFKSKLFSLTESSSGTGKTAAECASIMLNAYDVHDEEGFDKIEEENEEDENDEDYEENEEDEENAENNDEENEKTNTRNYVYENINDEGKSVSSRTYETFADDSAKNLEPKDNAEKVDIHSCVEIIKGKQKYGIHSGREFAVLLSSDIYHSDSLSATCIACYQAAKLSEGVDKPFVYKLISLINFIPKMICQVSWVIASLIVMRILYLPVDISFIVGAVSIVSFVLALLDAIYYYELANITVSNMIKLEIIDKNDTDICKQLMNIVALTETSRFLHSLRWFANKVLCYRV